MGEAEKAGRLPAGYVEHRGQRGRQRAWLAGYCLLMFSAASASRAAGPVPADATDAGGLASDTTASSASGADRPGDATSLQQLIVQGRVDNPEQVPALGKTGTKLEDVPASIQIIPREILQEQGATM